jgi:hypothetical protein
MKYLLTVILSLLVTSCMTPDKPAPQPTVQNYDYKMRSWLGHSVNELLPLFGAPSQVTKMPNGNTLYTFMEDRGIASNGYSVSNAYTPVVVNNTSSSRVYCQTDFMIDKKGIVQTYRFEGPLCTSY